MNNTTLKRRLNQLKGGPLEMSKVLASLPTADQKRILSEIRSRDPKLSQQIEELMISFEDLIHLTPKMLVDFVAHISMKDLGLALRGQGQSDDLKNFFLQHLPSNLKLEMQDSLEGKPVLMKECQLAQQRIMEKVRHLVEKGVLVLKLGSGDQWV